MAVFLVVEVGGMATPAVAYSRAHPGVTLDLFVQPSADPAMPLFVLCQGSGRDPGAVAGLRQALGKAYPGLRELPPLPGQSWMVTFAAPLSAVDETARVMARFAGTQGLHAVWGRLEEGIVFLRLLVPREAAVEDLAVRLRKVLAEHGIDGDISTEIESNDSILEWLEATRAILRQHAHP